MRICLVTDGFAPFVTGGIQSHSTNLSRHLSEAGADIVAVFPELAADRKVGNREIAAVIGERAEQVPIKWTNLPWFPGHYVAELWLYSRRVKKYLARRKDIDLAL